MLRAYRAGLLRPSYPFTLNSRIREMWLLEDIAAEQDADAALRVLQLKAAFSLLFEDKRKAFVDLLEQGSSIAAHGKGDPLAAHARVGKIAQENNLRELYAAMQKAGLLDLPENLPPPKPKNGRRAKH